MKTKFLLVLFTSGLLASAYGLLAPDVQAAAGVKNVKVLPNTWDKEKVKTVMKCFAKALGVQCDHCHDTDDMAKDTEKKEIARKMIGMQTEIDKKFFAGKGRVTCMTCHAGKVKPAL